MWATLRRTLSKQHALILSLDSPAFQFWPNHIAPRKQKEVVQLTVSAPGIVAEILSVSSSDNASSVTASSFRTSSRTLTFLDSLNFARRAFWAVLSVCRELARIPERRATLVERGGNRRPRGVRSGRRGGVRSFYHERDLEHTFFQTDFAHAQCQFAAKFQSMFVFSNFFTFEIL